MAKVTWLGEDETLEDGTQIAGPSFTTWGGVKFPKGEPVELKNPVVIAKAKANKFFSVEGGPGRPPKVSDGDQNP
jgi:hypothetical protein